MKVEQYFKSDRPTQAWPNTVDLRVTRVEIPLNNPPNYKIIILDAEESTDVVIEDPDGDREAVWTICKEHQEEFTRKEPSQS